jgi:hypothetical protein
VAEKFEIDTTIAEARKALGFVAGVPPESVEHYAIVIRERGALRTVFCCDDPADAARMLGDAAISILRDPQALASAGPQ